MAYTINHYTDVPTSWDNQCEVADYMEIRCITDGEGEYSAMTACKSAGMNDDDEDVAEDSLNSPDDRIYENVIDTLNYEVENRKGKSRGKYPFYTNGDSIILDENLDNYIRDVYMFLLLCTRLKMGGDGCNRTHCGLDGTKLFEQLCAKVLINYFGKNSLSFVFGTGADYEVKSFKDKLENLLKHIGEKNNSIKNDLNNHQKDGGIDVVLHIPFADKREGRFTAFAQCKTGHGWRDKISTCDPLAFMRDFFDQFPTFIPIAIFMVSESFNDNWRSLQLKSKGFLFDRSRIMEFLPDMTTEDNYELYKKIRSWNEAAKASIS